MNWRGQTVQTAQPQSSSTCCISSISSLQHVRVVSPHLIVHLPLQLDDLVLHTRVELFQMLSRTRFDLQLLQLPFSTQAPERTLDDDGGVACSSELLPLQPAADALLDDHGLVVQQELQCMRKKVSQSHGERGIQKPSTLNWKRFASNSLENKQDKRGASRRGLKLNGGGSQGFLVAKNENQSDVSTIFCTS